MHNNLPPGVLLSDIPGNRPEDEDWDAVLDWICDTKISARALQGLVVGWCKRNGKATTEPPLRSHKAREKAND